MAGAYVFTGRMVLATRTFRRFIESWPNHEELDYARMTLPIVEAIAERRIEEAGFTGADAFEMAEMHEESPALMDQGDYLKTIRSYRIDERQTAF